MAAKPVPTPDVAAQSAWVRRRAHWISWFRKSSLSVMDQGLVSGSNFVLNVLLARWMRPEQYGAYALGFSIFLLMTAMYQSLVLEPMSVLGPILYGDRPKRYLGALLRGQSLLLLAIAAALGIAAAIAGGFGRKTALSGALAGLAIASPAILLFWLARGACYLRANLYPVVQGAALYSALLLGGIVVVRRFWILNEFTAFLVIGLASAAISVHLLRALGPNLQTRDNPRPSEVSLEHWRFGRWELARAGFDWAGENISYSLTAAFLGMREVGELKAILTLFLPLSHIYTALRRLILPHLASVSGSHGTVAANASVKKVNLLTFAMSTVTCLILVFFGRWIFHLLYGGKFMEVAYLVPWAALSLVVTAPISGFDMGLRALRSPATVFTASATGASVSAAFYIVGTRMFGLPGTIAANVSAGLVYTLITAFLYYRRVAHAQTARSAQRI
jgi:O-antigen/teichoic acid export membrane protein